MDQRYRVDQLPGKSTADDFAGEMRDTDDREQVGETLLFLLLESAVDLVGGERETILRIETHQLRGAPESRTVELDVDPIDWMPPTIVETIVCVGSGFANI